MNHLYVDFKFYWACYPPYNLYFFQYICLLSADTKIFFSNHALVEGRKESQNNFSSEPTRNPPPLIIVCLKVSNSCR